MMILLPANDDDAAADDDHHSDHEGVAVLRGPADDQGHRHGRGKNSRWAFLSISIKTVFERYDQFYLYHEDTTHSEFDI